MRLIFALGLLLVATAFDVSGAKAQPWCAYYDAYTYNCGFYTFEQCLATISGVGGICQQNVMPPPFVQSRASKKRKKYRNYY